MDEQPVTELRFLRAHEKVCRLIAVLEDATLDDIAVWKIAVEEAAKVLKVLNTRMELRFKPLEKRIEETERHLNIHVGRLELVEGAASHEICLTPAPLVPEGGLAITTAPPGKFTVPERRYEPKPLLSAPTIERFLQEIDPKRRSKMSAESGAIAKAESTLEGVAQMAAEQTRAVVECNEKAGSLIDRLRAIVDFLETPEPQVASADKVDPREDPCGRLASILAVQVETLAATRIKLGGRLSYADDLISHIERLLSVPPQPDDVPKLRFMDDDNSALRKM